MLLDYYEHGFRFSDSRWAVITEDTVNHRQPIAEIQEAIVSQEVHICAAFARSRVKECALSLEELVSKVTNTEISKYARYQPLYSRVNTLKANTETVISMLVEEGFQFVEDVELTELTGKMFKRDPHFKDMLAFSKDCKDDVYSHTITMDLWLYPQVS